jgi:hypothetical protein
VHHNTPLHRYVLLTGLQPEAPGDGDRLEHIPYRLPILDLAVLDLPLEVLVELVVGVAVVYKTRRMCWQVVEEVGIDDCQGLY